ncbi:MAG TPA: hypothetical protein DDW50_06380 [Firmicutes bacterium]|nr:hypothetical protein [Bacillota bacterium]
MLENDITKFQQEIGAIKQDLISDTMINDLNDEESYRLATKIDLTVSRLMRILEHRNVNA